MIATTSVSPAYLHAGPYDGFQNKPGAIVTNNATTQYEIQGIPRPSLFAQSQATVEHISQPGQLTAYVYSPSDPSATTVQFTRSDFSTSGTANGPFVQQSYPDDQPSTAGSQTTEIIDLSGPIPLRAVTRIKDGATLFFVLDDNGLNISGSDIDTVIVTVTDIVTGDEEVIRLYETGTDSGLFNGYLETRRNSAGAFDGRLATIALSQIKAVYTDPYNVSRSLDEEVMVGPIDPLGMIFDSTTGAPINGAQITIIDVATGNPAEVYGDDLISIYPSTIVTGGVVTDGSGARYELADGSYRFPYVDPGQYMFSIVPPIGYTVPSALSDEDLATLPAGPFTITQGSRLGSFDIIPGQDIEIDIPADRLDLLAVQRTASDMRVETGDLVLYTVTASSGASLDADLTETLTAGLKMIPGSLQVDGHATSLPIITLDEQTFRIEGLPLAAGAPRVITYTTAVSTGAKTSAWHSTNSALTGPGDSIATDDHDLYVQEAFSTQTMAVIGDIVSGDCQDHDPDADLSGIRVFTEAGDYATTDAKGRFTIEGLTATDHVVQLDISTLPLGSKPKLCNDNVLSAGSEISQFIPGHGGTTQRVRFTISEGMSEITSDSDLADRARPKKENDQPWLTTGWLDRQKEQTTVVSPQEGHLPRTKSIDIALVREANVKTRIYVNGTEVPRIHVAKTQNSKNRHIALEQWHGIPIRDGKNIVEHVFEDAEGNVQHRVTRHVYYTNKIARSHLVENESKLVTDGSEQAEVVLQLVSEEGYPIHPGTIVSVKVNPPYAFAAKDVEGQSVRKTSRSTRVVTGKNGQIKLHMSPARRSGTATFRVETPNGDAIATAYISSANRPWSIAGLAQGRWAQSGIQGHLSSAGDLSSAYGGRVSVFGEGSLFKQWLTTFRIDTAKLKTSEDFSSTSDMAHVLYADKSKQGDASPSQYPIYLNIEGKNGSVTVGDYDVGIDTRLTKFNRSMSGGLAQVTYGALSAQAFIAESNGNKFTETFLSNGTVGPFALSNTGIVKGSESVTLVAIDVKNSDRQLSSETLSRRSDYIVDYLNNRIILRKTIPAFDAEQNRYALKISYETDDESAQGFLYGGHAEYQISENTVASLTGLSIDNVQGTAIKAQLGQAAVTANLSKTTKLSIEAAQGSKTNAEESLSASAISISGEYDAGRIDAEAFVTAKNGDINPNSSSLNADQKLSVGIETDIAIKYVGTGKSPKKRQTGYYLELEGRFDDNTTQKTTSGSTDIIFSRDFDRSAFGLGARINKTSTASIGSSLLGSASWVSQSGNLVADVDQSIMLGGYDYGQSSRATLSYQLSETTKVVTQAELKRRDDTLSYAISAGFEKDVWEGGTIRGGVLGSASDDDALTGAYGGAKQVFEVDDTSHYYIAYDALRGIGDDAPENVSSEFSGFNNENLTDPFQTLSAGYGRKEKTWSLGVDLDHTISGDISRTNAAISMTGYVNDEMQVFGSYRGSITHQDVGKKLHELRASAAHRAGFEDPFTQLSAKAYALDSSTEATTTIVATLYRDQKLMTDLTAYGRLGYKYVVSGSGDEAFDNALSLIGLGGRYDITPMISIGAHTTIMQDALLGSYSYSSGVSAGIAPIKNSLIEVGYNFYGYEDADFSESGWTDNGLYMQFSVKFDQTLFGSRN